MAQGVGSRRASDAGRREGRDVAAARHALEGAYRGARLFAPRYPFARLRATQPEAGIQTGSV